MRWTIRTGESRIHEMTVSVKIGRKKYIYSKRKHLQSLICMILILEMEKELSKSAC